MQDSRAGFLDALTVDLKHGRLFPDLVAAAVATPGVRSAAISLRLPTEQAGLRVPLRIDGDETNTRAIATLRPVTPRYSRLPVLSPPAAAG